MSAAGKVVLEAGESRQLQAYTRRLELGKRRSVNSDGRASFLSFFSTIDLVLLMVTYTRG
jgi:hypothetical protein